MSKKSLILSLLLIISCTDNPTESSNKKENLLMPLSIGNSWMYEVKQYSIFSETYREEVWVVEDTVILQGQEYYLIGVGGSPLKLLAATLDDGLFFSYYRQNSLYYPMFYKFPVSNSEKYEYNIPNTDSTITK